MAPESARNVSLGKGTLKGLSGKGEGEGYDDPSGGRREGGLGKANGL